MLRRSLLPACTLLISLVALPATVAGQGDDAKAAREFRRQFQGQPRQSPTPEVRQESIRLLAGLDSVDVGKALADASALLEKDLEQLDLERMQVNEELAVILKGQENTAKRVLPKPVLDQFNSLRDRSAKLRADVDALRQVRKSLMERVSLLKEESTVRWLAQEVPTSRKYPLTLKLAVARLAGTVDSPVVKEVLTVLDKAKDPADLTAILVGVAGLGQRAKEAADKVLRLLSHKESDVRVSAATALAQMAVPEAVLPMIGLLEKEEGQSQKIVAAALEVLTGQGHGTSASSWRAWFAAEGKAQLAAGTLVLGSGKSMLLRTAEPGQRKAAASDTTSRYYGIPQDGKSILYVLDCSGSMSAEVARKGAPGTSGNQGQTTTRMEASKEELIRAIQLLDSTRHFNVIWYNDLPHQWQTSMVRATPETIRAAVEWIQVLGPNSSTNIHDAMQLGFKLTGRGSFDKHYGIAVDMIFLLTDGSPTKPDGTLDSTDAILQAVRGWNPLGRVVIHCIGIGDQINATFLQSLSQENGGIFERR